MGRIHGLEGGIWGVWGGGRGGRAEGEWGRGGMAFNQVRRRGEEKHKSTSGEDGEEESSFLYLVCPPPSTRLPRALLGISKSILQHVLIYLRVRLLLGSRCFSCGFGVVARVLHRCSHLPCLLVSHFPCKYQYQTSTSHYPQLWEVHNMVVHRMDKIPVQFHTHKKLIGILVCIRQCCLPYLLNFAVAETPSPFPLLPPLRFLLGMYQYQLSYTIT